MGFKSLYNNLNLMKLLILLLCVSSFLFIIAKSEVISVGPDSRWSDGVGYTSWAQTLNLTVGDVLVFSYSRGSHNVLDVTAASYRSCDNNTGVNARYESGNDHVELKEAKQYWFICTVEEHCQLGGMKFTVNVSAPTTTSVNSSMKHINNVGFYYVLLVGILSLLSVFIL